jgi:CheY-like chemotaxis protein
MDREKRSLLLVDGSATYLFYLAMLLKKLEYTVRTTTSAEDALQTLDASRPDLVITDAALPRMSGIDLMKQMKRDQRFKTIPVIIHTGATDPMVKETCLREGCANFLTKPAEPDTLYRSIQAATESVPRQSIRIDTSLKAELGEKSASAAVRAEYVTALSDGGCYVKSAAPEPVNTVIPLKIFFPSREVKVKAIVLYSSAKIGDRHPTPGMGMKFVGISQEDKTVVQDFIKQQVTKDLVAAR